MNPPNHPAIARNADAGSANLPIGSVGNNVGLPIDALNAEANREIGGPGGIGSVGNNGGLPIDAPNAEANREIGGPGGIGGRGDRWRSRGYLPHFEGTEIVRHVSIHLADSLPKEALERMELELNMAPPEKRDMKRRKKIEAWVDAGHGSCVLQEPAVAEMAQNALLYFDAERYALLAWVVMPNHMHVVFEPREGWTVAKIVATWKKFTAGRIKDFLRRRDVEANREIGGPGGVVWHREYWDRYMRNETHLRETIEYVHLNPVAAGLVARAEDWAWSSAGNAGSANLPIGTCPGEANGEIGGTVLPRCRSRIRGARIPAAIIRTFPRNG